MRPSRLVSNRPFDPDAHDRTLRSRMHRHRGSISLYALLLFSSTGLTIWSFHEQWILNHRCMCMGFVLISAAALWNAMNAKRRTEEAIADNRRLIEHLKS